MKVGDLVKETCWNRTWRGTTPQRFGIIIEVWLDDPHWGDTAVVEWLDGFREEITADNLEVVPCK